MDKYKEYKANGGIIPETSPTPEPEITEIPIIESNEENPENINSSIEELIEQYNNK